MGKHVLEFDYYFFAISFSTILGEPLTCNNAVIHKNFIFNFFTDL